MVSTIAASVVYDGTTSKAPAAAMPMDEAAAEAAALHSLRASMGLLASGEFDSGGVDAARPAVTTPETSAPAAASPGASEERPAIVCCICGDGEEDGDEKFLVSSCGHALCGDCCEGHVNSLLGDSSWASEEGEGTSEDDEVADDDDEGDQSNDDGGDDEDEDDWHRPDEWLDFVAAGAEVKCPAVAEVLRHGHASTCGTALPVSQLRQKLKDRTFDCLHQACMQAARKEGTTKERDRLASKFPVIADSLLEEQLADLMPTAYECPSCGFGPIEHRNCDDLSAHHGERGTDNSCPRCAFFSSDIKAYRRWRGKIPENTAAAVVAAPMATTAAAGRSSSARQRLIRSPPLEDDEEAAAMARTRSEILQRIKWSTLRLWHRLKRLAVQTLNSSLNMVDHVLNFKTYGFSGHHFRLEVGELMFMLGVALFAWSFKGPLFWGSWMMARIAWSSTCWIIHRLWLGFGLARLLTEWLVNNIGSPLWRDCGYPLAKFGALACLKSPLIRRTYGLTAAVAMLWTHAGESSFNAILNKQGFKFSTQRETSSFGSRSAGRTRHGNRIGGWVPEILCFVPGWLLCQLVLDIDIAGAGGVFLSKAASKVVQAKSWRDSWDAGKRLLDVFRDFLSSPKECFSTIVLSGAALLFTQNMRDVELKTVLACWFVCLSFKAVSWFELAWGASKATFVVRSRMGFEGGATTMPLFPGDGEEVQGCILRHNLIASEQGVFLPLFEYESRAAEVIRRYWMGTNTSFSIHFHGFLSMGAHVIIHNTRYGNRLKFVDILPLLLRPWIFVGIPLRVLLYEIKKPQAGTELSSVARTELKIAQRAGNVLAFRLLCAWMEVAGSLTRGQSVFVSACLCAYVQPVADYQLMKIALYSRMHRFRQVMVVAAAASAAALLAIHRGGSTQGP